MPASGRVDCSGYGNASSSAGIFFFAGFVNFLPANIVVKVLLCRATPEDWIKARHF